MTTGLITPGAVTVGGPIDVRELDAVTIAKVAVGGMNNNAYLIRDRATGDGAADRRRGRACAAGRAGRLWAVRR